MKPYQIERIKRNYPVGTRVQLTSSMLDEKGMPTGLRGTVTYVDDLGSIGVNWENGRTLSLLQEDSFKKLPKYEMKSVSAEEKSLFYSSDKNDAERGCVGHFRADFGSGEQFYSTWNPHNDDVFNTPKFKEDLQIVVDDLMADGLLKDRPSMSEYCRTHECARLEDNTFGFKADTESYEFYIRCTPAAGGYDIYLYGYDKSQQVQNMAEENEMEMGGQSL